jgi:hypothetical protein
MQGLLKPRPASAAASVSLPGRYLTQRLPDEATAEPQKVPTVALPGSSSEHWLELLGTQEKSFRPHGNECSMDCVDAAIFQ